MKFDKKQIILLLACLVLSLFTINTNVQAKTATVVVGTQGSDAQIWRHIAQSTAAKKAHLTIKVKEINDGIQLNRATAEGSVDANAFQSYGYLMSYNHDNPQGKLVPIGTTYLEPLGLYSKKYRHLRQLPKHAKIAIADDPANQTRSLQLLQHLGLIKLQANHSTDAAIADVHDNPHRLRFYPVNSSTVPRVLDDVAAGLITNTVAQESGLNVWHDTLAHEKLNRSTQKNINIIAVRPQSSHKPAMKKLVQLYRQPSIQRYIQKSFHHTKILVKEPISKLKESNHG